MLPLVTPEAMEGVVDTVGNGWATFVDAAVAGLTHTLSFGGGKPKEAVARRSASVGTDASEPHPPPSPDRTLAVLLLASTEEAQAEAVR